MSKGNLSSLKVIVFALFFPIILLLAIDYSINGPIPDFELKEINPRVANSALTSFILCSFFLLGNMYFYGESRNRRLAPLFGMLVSSSIGILAAVFFINQGPILLEDHDSIRAQLVYNISHTIVSFLALLLALMISLGLLFSSITHSNSKVHIKNFQEEE